jgi:hypothetical protein
VMINVVYNQKQLQQYLGVYKLNHYLICFGFRPLSKGLGDLFKALQCSISLNPPWTLCKGALSLG